MFGKNKARYQSTKTYNTDKGLSCCFRQWRATHSHCSMLHGYSIGVKLVFESETLDDRNWCFDFGGLKPFKAWLEYMFDHTLLIAEDDPELETFKELYQKGERGENGEYSALLDLRVVPAVGCEAFAKLAYDKMAELLEEAKHGDGRYPANPDVRLVSAEVFEHGANSAIYLG